MHSDMTPQPPLLHFEFQQLLKLWRFTLPTKVCVTVKAHTLDEAKSFIDKHLDWVGDTRLIRVYM